jgi:hypothetical protein
MPPRRAQDLAAVRRPERRRIDAWDVARTAPRWPTRPAALLPAEAARCSVAGTSTDCNVVDSIVVRRRLAGRGPLRAQICPAAL